MSALRSLICVPTYNEADNIALIIQEIFRFVPESCDILIVDDGSPDGTAEIVERLRVQNLRLHILNRTHKNGLAAAYLAAFHWGLQRGYDWIFEMDADFSHNPRHLPEFFQAIEEGHFDAVLGSRYVKGGGVSNWSKQRLLLSRCGSIYARNILRFHLTDWTGGFNAWSRKVLESIDLPSIRSKGYAFQIELKYRSLNRHLRVKEIPIIFEERRAGESKMSGSIVKEAIFGVLSLKLREHV